MSPLPCSDTDFILTPAAQSYRATEPNVFFCDAVVKSAALHQKSFYEPCGVTGAPSTKNCVPETITLSPAFTPSSTT